MLCSIYITVYKQSLASAFTSTDFFNNLRNYHTIPVSLQIEQKIKSERSNEINLEKKITLSEQFQVPIGKI